MIAHACYRHSLPDGPARLRHDPEQFGVPSTLDRLKAQDIPAIATAALEETHLTYAVPRYMDKATCERCVAQMLVQPPSTELIESIPI